MKKRFINLTQEHLSPDILLFLKLWRKNNKYDQTELFDLYDCLELIIALTRNLHSDDSDPRFFNNCMSQDESLIAWDGEELIDILFYEVIHAIKQKLKSGRVLRDNQDNGIINPKEGDMNAY